MSDVKNRAGIRPAETVKKYSVTTDDVATFLQNKINVFTTNERNNGKKVEDIKINLISISFSKKYVPFLVVFPENSFDRQERYDNNGVASIFLDDSQHAANKIHPAAWSAVQPYVYVADEKNLLKNSKRYRDSLEIDTATGKRVARMCAPAIHNLGKGQRVCLFLLDPLRLFADMFCEEGELNHKTGNYSFLIGVEKGTTRITEGIYRYEVSKTPKPRKAGNVKESDIHKLIRSTMNN